jgi:arginine/ornithine N-succinyltransferase beta subunit
MLSPQTKEDAPNLSVQVIKLLTVVVLVRPVVHTLLLGIFQVAVVSAPGLNAAPTKFFLLQDNANHALHALQSHLMDGGVTKQHVLVTLSSIHKEDANYVQDSIKLPEILHNVVQLVLKSLAHQHRLERNRVVSHVENATLFHQINLDVLSLVARVIQ